MFNLIKNIARGARSLAGSVANFFSGPSYQEEMEADLAQSSSLHDLEARQRSWDARR